MRSSKKEISGIVSYIWPVKAIRDAWFSGVIVQPQILKVLDVEVSVAVLHPLLAPAEDLADLRLLSPKNKKAR